MQGGSQGDGHRCPRYLNVLNHVLMINNHSGHPTHPRHTTFMRHGQAHYDFRSVEPTGRYPQRQTVVYDVLPLQAIAYRNLALTVLGKMGQGSAAPQRNA